MYFQMKKNTYLYDFKKFKLTFTKHKCVNKTSVVAHTSL